MIESSISIALMMIYFISVTKRSTIWLPASKNKSLIEIYLINFNYKDIMTIHLLPTLASIANIIDMINPRLNSHHVGTAFIASHLANLVGFLRPAA